MYTVQNLRTDSATSAGLAVIQAATGKPVTGIGEVNPDHLDALNAFANAVAELSNGEQVELAGVIVSRHDARPDRSPATRPPVEVPRSWTNHGGTDYYTTI